MIRQLRNVPFFEKHSEFWVSPWPHTYGRNAETDPEAELIGYGSGDRGHILDVKRVGISTSDRLVIFTKDGQKLTFEPLTLERWNQYYANYGLTTDDEVRRFVRDETTWG